MKSFQHLAQVHYAALTKESEKVDGLKARPWAQLIPAEQAAWIVAMQAVVAELEAIH